MHRKANTFFVPPNFRIFFSVASFGGKLIAITENESTAAVLSAQIVRTMEDTLLPLQLVNNAETLTTNIKYRRKEAESLKIYENEKVCSTASEV
jgi:hypothetical protein